MFVAPLKKQRKVKHGIRVVWVGIDGVLETKDRLIGASLLVENIGEIVPGLRESRVGIDG